MKEKTLNLLVNGMKYCDDAEKVDASLRKFAAVRNVQILFETNTLRVTFNPEELDEATLKATVKDLGFDVK